MLIELTSPFNYRDSDLTSIELDLEHLTGQDLIDIEAMMRAGGNTRNIFDMSQESLIAIAGKASHINPEELKNLAAPDFIKITGAVLTFLSSAVSQV